MQEINIEYTQDWFPDQPRKAFCHPFLQFGLGVAVSIFEPLMYLSLVHSLQLWYRFEATSHFQRFNFLLIVKLVYANELVCHRLDCLESLELPKLKQLVGPLEFAGVNGSGRQSANLSFPVLTSAANLMFTDVGNTQMPLLLQAGVVRINGGAGGNFSFPAAQTIARLQLENAVIGELDLGSLRNWTIRPAANALYLLGSIQINHWNLSAFNTTASDYTSIYCYPGTNFAVTRVTRPNGTIKVVGCTGSCTSGSWSSAVRGLFSGPGCP